MGGDDWWADDDDDGRGYGYGHAEPAPEAPSTQFELGAFLEQRVPSRKPNKRGGAAAADEDADLQLALKLSAQEAFAAETAAQVEARQFEAAAHASLAPRAAPRQPWELDLEARLNQQRRMYDLGGGGEGGGGSSSGAGGDAFWGDADEDDAALMLALRLSEEEEMRGAAPLDDDEELAQVEEQLARLEAEAAPAPATWTCPLCTFANAAADDECAMGCGGRRPATAPTAAPPPAPRGVVAGGTEADLRAWAALELEPLMAGTGADGASLLECLLGIEDDAEVAEYATSFLGDVAAGFAAEFCARRAALVR